MLLLVAKNSAVRFQVSSKMDEIRNGTTLFLACRLSNHRTFRRSVLDFTPTPSSPLPPTTPQLLPAATAIAALLSATTEVQSAATVEMQMTQSSAHVRLLGFFHLCMRFIVHSVHRLVGAIFLKTFPPHDSLTH